MKSKKILAFDEYEKLFEADQGNEVVLLASQIMLAFYGVYSALLPLADGYSNVLNDVQELAMDGKEVDEDPTGKSISMYSVIDNIMTKVDKKYKDLMPLFKEASDTIIESYITLVGQIDKGDSEVRDVANVVSKSAVTFIKDLKDSKKEVRENLNHSKYELLYEARNMKERNDLLQMIVSAKAGVKATRGIKSLEASIKAYNSELDEFTKKLDKDNEEYWKSIKRKERKDEFTKIESRITEIGLELQAKNIKQLRRLDSNNEAIKELNAGVEKFKVAMEKLSSVNSETIRNPDTSPEEEKKAAKEMGVDSENAEKGDKKEYKNIDPDDIENSRKAGENRDIIKDYQEKANLLMEPDKDYSKIKADGLYGKNTKKAISNVQEVLNKLGAGLNTKGSLTAQTQKSMDAFIQNKDQILALLKNKD